MEANSEDLARLRGMYAAEFEYLRAGPGTTSAATLLGFFDPDVVLRQAQSLPFGGDWRGHRQLEWFFDVMSRTWARFDVLEQRILSSKAPLVVLTWVDAQARVSNRELTFPIMQTIDMRDGLITEVRPFYWDTSAIVNACLPDPAAE